MNHQNFRDWYADILNDLYRKPNAGLAIMMIVLPLLERYLRDKSGTVEATALNDKAYADFRDIFPEIKTNENAISFWGVFRHGLLHQAAFSRKDYRGAKVPHGGLSYNVDTIEIINGNIWVNPKMFAQRVVVKIEDDFRTFENIQSEKHKFPVVGPVFDRYCGTASPDVWPSNPFDKEKKGG